MKNLPVPAKQPFQPDAAQKVLLDQMNTQFGTLQTTTTYVFVDKPLLVSLHDSGDISDTVFDGIKAQLALFEIDFDTMPAKFEGYKIDGLGAWQFPPPSP